METDDNKYTKNKQKMPQTKAIYFQNKVPSRTSLTHWEEDVRTNTKHLLVLSLNCTPGKYSDLKVVMMTLEDPMQNTNAELLKRLSKQHRWSHYFSPRF